MYLNKLKLISMMHESPNVFLYSCTLNGKSYFPKGRTEPLIDDEARRKLEKEYGLDVGPDFGDVLKPIEDEVVMDEL